MVADVSVGNTTGSQQVICLLVDGSAVENLPLVLASIYIPNESHPVADRDAAFERLGANLVHYQQHWRVVLMGDFNARVGQALLEEGHIGRYGEPTINGNGSRLKNAGIYYFPDVWFADGTAQVILWCPWRSSLDPVFVAAYICVYVWILEQLNSDNLCNVDVRLINVRKTRTYMYYKYSKRMRTDYFYIVNNSFVGLTADELGRILRSQWVQLKFNIYFLLSANFLGELPVLSKRQFQWAVKKTNGQANYTSKTAQMQSTGDKFTQSNILDWPLIANTNTVANTFRPIT